MPPPAVAVFTDTYLPTVNGVTYTIQTWRDRWQARNGRMDIVYPDSDHQPVAGEYPVGSVAFPFYEGFRTGLPRVPAPIRNVDVVHAHTPFTLGIGAKRLARRSDRPLIASHHTPSAEYAAYIADGRLGELIEGSARRYERWFLDGADAVTVPTEAVRTRLEDRGVTGPIDIVPNGVDIDVFAPDADGAEALRERYDLPDGPLVGYTGRHGYEKELPTIVRAVADLDVTLVFAGDGPARGDLEALADELDVPARFLGFLDRAELPAFYTALDVFAFPSPVETQGLVALEANACGTPVAGVDAGALAETVVTGETGYRAPPGDAAAFASVLQQTLDERDRLSARCLDRRESISADHAVDRLAAVYERVLGEAA